MSTDEKYIMRAYTRLAGDDGWTCPVCHSLCGPAIEYCEGYIDIADGERGETVELDATHARVMRAVAIRYQQERGLRLVGRKG